VLLIALCGRRACLVSGKGRWGKGVYLPWFRLSVAGGKFSFLGWLSDCLVKRAARFSLKGRRSILTAFRGTGAFQGTVVKEVGTFGRQVGLEVDIQGLEDYC